MPPESTPLRHHADTFPQMRDELTTTVELPSPVPGRRRGVSQPLLRFRHGMRRTHNWLQLARFGAVGRPVTSSTWPCSPRACT